MKTIVSMQDLRELEIKPSDLVGEYRRLLEKEARAFWTSKGFHKLVACPACGAAKTAPAFEKWAVSYRRCGSCASLFAEVRPTEAELKDFYAASEACAFWRTKVLKATESARLEKIHAPRAAWVLDGVAEYLPGAVTALDDTPYGLPMLEAIVSGLPALESIISAHPLSGQAAPASRARIIPSAGALYAKPAPKVDFITAFDALDRAADPAAFAASCWESLNAGGLLFITAACASGLEIQLLGAKSPSILPPDRLNLFSVEGLQSAFGAKKWEICEISTPGMFDVALVRKELEEGGVSAGAFFDYLFGKRGTDCFESLQEFLQANRLSSFARLIARKK